MKVGDLVKLKNLHPEWGKVGLITKIHTTPAGLGKVVLLAGVDGYTLRSIPWVGRTKYLEAINENR